MEKYKNIWNDISRKDINKLAGNLIVYDTWLEKFDNYIKSVNTPIIDLGCGIGNDTLYLINKGKKVISVDFSRDALHILKENIPVAFTIEMDMAKEYTLEKNSADVIVANLSLHYFDTKTTEHIISNIKDTLKEDGLLIFRVNSVNDINYDANHGEEIEKHYYKTSNIHKRFFDKNDIEFFFAEWQIMYCKEEEICTSIHSTPKHLWECVVKK